MKGIDLSHWNGKIDFGRVKKSGIEFVILKAGGSDNGFYKDNTFEKNYTAAKKARLHVGAYYFVGKKCTNKDAGKADAERFIEILNDKKFDMPVYIDFEAPSPNTKKGNTDACIGFCETMENTRYFVGIYASDIAGFVDRLNKDKLRSYAWWVARYGKKPEHAKPYGMWQYTSTGKVDGINGNVDIDECYENYPKIIKENGLNGY